jgi:hypothetical protein
MPHLDTLKTLCHFLTTALQAVMEGRVGFGSGSAGLQVTAGSATNSLRSASDPSNWMKQQPYVPAQVPILPETLSLNYSKGVLTSKQPQQQQPAAALPPVNHLFGSDGCLRSHLIQEVPRRAILFSSCALFDSCPALLAVRVM